MSDSSLSGEFPSQLAISSHPEKDMPDRIFEIQNSIYIENEDSGKPVRLKDFCDISENGHVESIDRSDKRPIVHWITEGIETQLAIADGKELVYVEGLLEKHNHPIGTIVQLERIGYAIVEKDGLLMVHD